MPARASTLVVYAIMILLIAASAATSQAVRLAARDLVSRMRSGQFLVVMLFLGQNVMSSTMQIMTSCITGGPHNMPPLRTMDLM